MDQHLDREQALRKISRQEMRNVKFNFAPGNIGIFMQTTLAIIFMYMVFLSYSALGTTGLILVSVLFLLALFSPLLYRAGRRLLGNRRTQASVNDLQTEAEQEN
jgi:hypothetical protein